MPETLDTLVVKLTAELDALRRDLRTAQQESQRAGEAAGQAFSDGMRRNSAGKLIDDKGRFVAEGREAGQAAGREAARGFDQSFQQNAQQATAGTAGLGAQFMALRGTIAAATAAAAAWTGNQMVQQLVGLAKEAQAAENAQMAFERSVRRAGLSVQEANGLIAELADKYGASTTAASKAAETLIRNGASLQQVQQAFTAVGASAAREGKNIGEAWDAVSTALVTGRSELIENYGLITNFGPVYDKYKKEIKATGRELTEQERITAGLNAILKETSSEIQDQDIYLQGLTRSENENLKAKSDLRREIGDALKPAVTALMDEQTRALKSALDWAKANEDTLKPALAGAAIAIVDATGAARVLLGLMVDIGKATGGLATVIVGFGLTVAGGLTGGINAALTEIKRLFTSSLDQLAALQQAWGRLKLGDFNGARQIVQESIGATMEALKSAPGNILDGATSGAQWGLEAMRAGAEDIAAFGTAATGAAAAADAASTRIRGALDGLVQGQELVAALGLGGRRRGAPYGNKYLDGNHTHNGEDYFAPTGTPLYAPFTGQLTTRYSKTTGNIVEMLDAAGNKILLGHLERFAAGLQEAIKRAGGRLMVQGGTLVGYVGETGTMANVMGAKNNDHVHVMAYNAQGKLMDPLKAQFRPFDAPNAWSGPDRLVKASAPIPPTADREGPITAAQVVKAQAEIRAQEKLEKALRNTSRARLEQLANGTVGENGLTLEKWKAARAEIERRDRLDDQADKEARARTQRRAELERQISAEVTAGKIADAQRTLAALKRSQQEELDAAGDNAAKRAAIIEKTAPAILAAERSINAKVRNQAIQAAQAWADEQTKLGVLSADKIEKERVRRVRQAYAAEVAANDAAQSEQNRAVKDAGRERAQFEKQLQSELAGLKIEQAQQTATRLKAIEDADVKAHEGNLQKQLELTRKYSQAQFDRAELIARKIRDRAIADAKGKPNEAALVSVANETYSTTVGQARIARLNAVRDAQKAVTTSAKELRDEYSRLASSMRDKVLSGKVSDSDLQAYLKSLDELDRKMNASGQVSNRFVQAARQNAAALYQQGIDAQIAAGAFDSLADSHDRAAKANAGYTVTLKDALDQLPTGTAATEAYVAGLEDLARQGKVSKDVLDAVKEAIADRTVRWQLEADAIQRVTQEGLDNAQALSDLGDTEGAINSLYTVLDDLYTRLKNGEDVADAINRVTDAINGLGAALEQDTEFNTFIAGLSGTLSDQIEAVADKLAETVDNPKLAARLKAYLADLRKQLAQAYSTDPYSAGYINNGSVPSKTSGPDYQTIARARDLGTALAEETDPAQLQGLMAEITEFLASDIAQSLPEATRKGLEDGVRDAQGYINILGSITEDTITDGWERATKNVKPPPTNEFTDWADKIFGLGRAGLADPTQKNALVESLQQARQESRLTEADLQNLLALIDEFTREPEPATIGKAFDLPQWQKDIQELTDQFDSGTITAEQYTEGLHNAAGELYEMAAAAEAAGNIPLAERFREQAVALRALNPEIVRTLRTLGKVQKYAEYVQDLASAFGQLADAAGNGDLAANLNGIGNLAGKVATLAGDVMRIIANPADIGAWVRAITNIIGGIAEALGGFKKAHAEAKRLKDEFQDQNPLLNAGDYQKTFVRSRGFFADLFGGGPEVVNEIDKLGYTFAKTMQSSFVDGITNGLKEALARNDFSLFSKTLKESVYDGILKGVVDAFINGELLKGIIAPAIKAWSDALKTPNTADDAAALAGIDAAVNQVDALAQKFYGDVVPRLQSLGQEWGIGQADPNSPASGTLFGNAPGVQLGIPRIEVSLPADAFAPLTAFAAIVPRWETITTRLETVLGGGVTLSAQTAEVRLPEALLRPLSDLAAASPGFAAAVPVFASGAGELRQAVAEWRGFMQRGGGSGGPPPLTGNGGLT